MRRRSVVDGDVDVRLDRHYGYGRIKSQIQNQNQNSTSRPMKIRRTALVCGKCNILGSCELITNVLKVIVRTL